MAITPFLAMTAAEIAANPVLPEKVAWMACHFSPYGLGLSNLPQILPAGSVLMVDDITPIRGHDPHVILDQLARIVETADISGIFLDFQRPNVEETAALITILSEALPCPVAVSQCYASVCSCAVCLPPVPPSEPPEAYFSPWKDRELWLEIGTEAETVTVTETGTVVRSAPPAEPVDTDFFDERLLCHYRKELREMEVLFTLYRTPEDQRLLLAEAETFGIVQAVGLYQEFG